MDRSEKKDWLVKAYIAGLTKELAIHNSQSDIRITVEDIANKIIGNEIKKNPVLDLSVVNIGLSIRTLKAIDALTGYPAKCTIGNLLDSKINNLLKIRNFGRKSYEELINQLIKSGVTMNEIKQSEEL